MSGTEKRLGVLAIKCKKQDEITISGKELALLYWDLEKALAAIRVLDETVGAMKRHKKHIDELMMEYANEVDFDE